MTSTDGISSEAPTDHAGPAERALLISSDGHVAARMEDYRPYLPSSWHEEFDAFCARYREKATRTFRTFMDPDVLEFWDQNVIAAGRLDGLSDPHRRLEELEREGVVAEVLFPDSGQPFQLYSSGLAAAVGFRRTAAQIDVANRAYNRWLADFCQTAPQRFAGLALVSFDDVDAALAEIRWAKQAGLRGIVLPMFDDDVPLFDERFDPIWSELEELEMPANSHVANSSISRSMPTAAINRVRNAACARPLFTQQLFFNCQQILTQLIWGEVLELHPRLQVAFTEQGSGWVIGALQSMDHSWENSYLSRDVRQFVPRKPSEYFRRQCHLGSSLFSLAEAEARHELGVDKIAIGMDYPHPEGTWGLGPGTPAYLQATLGAAGVPADEARRMLAENAARLWDFDVAALRPVADRVGPVLDQLLTAPAADLFPRGDVHKPLATGI